MIEDFIIKVNTIIEVGGLEAWEVEMDVLEGEEVPSLEVVEVPNQVEEASRIQAALLRVVEVACRALEVFLPLTVAAWDEILEVLEAVEAGA